MATGWEDGAIAYRQGGGWLFIAPRDGMRVFDRSAGQVRLYDGGWIAPSTPASPSGGTVVDTGARAAIAALVSALQSAGIFGDS